MGDPVKLKQIAIAIDQLANTILGGYADETMSARCWRLRRFYPYRFLRPAIDTVFFWQLDHCRLSHEAELQRLQAPREDSAPQTTLP